MDEDLVKRRQRELSKKQAIYVAQRERGVPRQQSAVMAGYADVDKAGEQVEQSLAVQEELEKARTEIAEITGVTKEMLAQHMLDALEMARTMADPQSMVRAASELGKLLGLYAPEIRKIEHGLTPESQAAIKRMTDAQLLQLAGGRIIEGESKVVPNAE